MHVDRLGIPGVVAPPGDLENLAPVDESPLPAQKQLEQGEYLRRQMDGEPVVGEDLPHQVDAERAVGAARSDVAMIVRGGDRRMAGS